MILLCFLGDTELTEQVADNLCEQIEMDEKNLVTSKKRRIKRKKQFGSPASEVEVCKAVGAKPVLLQPAQKKAKKVLTDKEKELNVLKTQAQRRTDEAMLMVVSRNLFKGNMPANAKKAMQAPKRQQSKNQMVKQVTVAEIEDDSSNSESDVEGEDAFESSLVQKHSDSEDSESQSEEVLEHDSHETAEQDLQETDELEPCNCETCIILSSHCELTIPASILPFPLYF